MSQRSAGGQFAKVISPRTSPSGATPPNPSPTTAVTKAATSRHGPPTIADTSIEAVAGVMVANEARRVPVVDGRLEGIITITDVIRAIAEDEAAGNTDVGDLASRTVNTIYVGTPLTVAERELSHSDVPYGVVLDDDGEMCGILTEVDILEVAHVVESEAATGESIANEDDEWMWEGIKAVGNRYFPTRNVEIPAEPVSEFMTADVVTVGKTRTAQEAARVMLTNDIEQIPLVSGSDFVGIVRDVNLLTVLSSF